MGDNRTVAECEITVGGIKKVCHEKHKAVNQRFGTMEEQIKSINNKLLAILFVVIVEVIIVVATGFIKDNNVRSTHDKSNRPMSAQGRDAGPYP